MIRTILAGVTFLCLCANLAFAGEIDFTPAVTTVMDTVAPTVVALLGVVVSWFVAVVGNAVKRYLVGKAYISAAQGEAMQKMLEDQARGFVLSVVDRGIDAYGPKIRTWVTDKSKITTEEAWVRQVAEYVNKSAPDALKVLGVDKDHVASIVATMAKQKLEQFQQVTSPPTAS